MRSLRVSEDIVPVSDFKARTSDWLRRVGDTERPVVITQNGKAAGILLSPASFDRLTERARFLAAVEEGIGDADAGRVTDHVAVVAAMQKRYGRPPKR